MNLLDYYLLVSVILLVAFGLLFKVHSVAPIWTFLGKIVINLTSLLGAGLILTRYGVIGA